MNTYLRNKPAGVQLLIFGGLFIGLFLIVSLLGMGIVARYNHLTLMQLASMTPADYARPERAGVIRGMLFVQFFLFLTPALVFAYLSDPHPLDYIGFRPPQRPLFIGLVIVTMFAAYFIVEFLGMINEYIVHILPAQTQNWILKGEEGASGILENILSMKNAKELLVSVFLVGLLPAISEELFFRGILQRILIQICKKPWPGMVITAAIFSAIHMQFMGFLPRMALGIVLGAVYWYSGSLLISMLGHFLFNTTGILLIYLKMEDLDSKYSPNLIFSIIGLISIATLVFLLNYFRKKSVTDYDQEYPPPAEYSIFDDHDQPV